MYDIIPVTSPARNDCGATCLKMLLSYYGTEIDLSTLAEECNTRFIGCTAKDLLRVGKAHGLDMIAFQMDAEEVLRQDRPAIVWWRYNHWVVFAGLDTDGRVAICNPDKGFYRIDAELFCAIYSGVSLWNGEPHDLPAPEPQPEPDDYGERITALEDELSATKIILGVE